MRRMPLACGLLGCGHVAHRHARALLDGRVPGVQLAAVADNNVARANAFGRQYGVASFASIDRMVLGSNLDIISILTPSGLHAQHIREAIEHDLVIVVEKPLALSVDDVDQILACCKVRSIRLFVVMQYRLNPILRELRGALDRHILGDLNYGSVRVRLSRPQEYYAREPWRSKRALDGGVLFNQAIHHLDLMVWMMGPVASAMATSARRMADIETEDVVAATLRFTSGALGSIEAMTCVRPEDLECEISVLGSFGSIVVFGPRLTEVRYCSTKCGTPVFSPSAAVGHWNGHESFYQDVFNALVKGSAPAFAAEEAKLSIQLAHAIARTAASRQEVAL
jgi:UDP-N-acetyl-2-amino-2-deoxyglucuronate dehydrogenase